MRTQGPSPCLSRLQPDVDGQPQAVPLRLLQAALSILGYVEADKENGESVWVAPSAPAVLCPGDAPPQGSHWGRGWRNLGSTWCLLCPVLYPEITQSPALWGLPGCRGGRQGWMQTLPALWD